MEGLRKKRRGGEEIHVTKGKKRICVSGGKINGKIARREIYGEGWDEGNKAKRWKRRGKGATEGE